jgi:replicative DNA helicase
MNSVTEYANYEECFISCFFNNAVNSNLQLIDSGMSITPDMIEKKEIKAIYKAIVEMTEQNLPISSMTLRQHCNQSPVKIPAMVFFDLESLGQPSSHIDYYGKLILESYKKKQLQIMIEGLSEGLKKSKSNPDELLKGVIDKFNAIGGDIKQDINIKQQHELACEFLEHTKNKIGREKVVTGYSVLDTHIEFDKQMTMFIGGRSGTGKTTFAYELINDYAKAFKTKVLFVSLEMPAVPLFRRSVATVLGKAELRNFSKVELNEKFSTHGVLEKYVGKTIEEFKSILVYDTAAVNMKTIEQAIQLARRKFGSVDIVAVDYIGYIKAVDGKTQTEKVGNLARETKEIAKRLDIRFVMLSQTNRDGGTDGTTEVSMHHFKDSGSIEESADIALGIWQSKKDKNRIHGKILKNREGEKNIPFDLIRYTTHLKEAPNILEEDELEGTVYEKKGKK